MAEPMTSDVPSVQSRYKPWDEWLDGRSWRLLAGRDFTCKPESLRVLATSAAARRGLRVRMRRIKGKKRHGWLLQAVKP